MNVGEVGVVTNFLDEDSLARSDIGSLAFLTTINELRARLAESTASYVCVFVWWASTFLRGLIIFPTIIRTANIALSSVGIENSDVVVTSLTPITTGAADAMIKTLGLT